MTKGRRAAQRRRRSPRAGAVLARQVAEYRKAHGRLRGEAGRGQPDAEGHVEHLGRPDGKACRDYHRQCLEWADSVGLPGADCCLSSCLTNVLPAVLSCAMGRSLPLGGWMVAGLRFRG